MLLTIDFLLQDVTVEGHPQLDQGLVLQLPDSLVGQSQVMGQFRAGERAVV